MDSTVPAPQPDQVRAWIASAYQNNSDKLKRISAMNCEGQNGSVEPMDLLNGAIAYIYQGLLIGRVTYSSESELVGLILRQIQNERKAQFRRYWQEAVFPPPEMAERVSATLPPDLWMDVLDLLEMIRMLPVKVRDNFNRIWELKLTEGKLTREDYRQWEQAITLLRKMRDND